MRLRIGTHGDEEDSFFWLMSEREREDNQHVGWGGGIHSCVGGPLARLEVNLAFENFIGRVENPRLVEDPPPYRRSPMFRGPQHLWVEFDRITD